MSTTRKDDAVSPVIGTILLVAITVVLVAIVAAVVMGMAGGVQNTKDVGVKVTPVIGSDDHSVATVTFTGGRDVVNLVGVISMYEVGKQGVIAETTEDKDFVVGKPYKLIAHSTTPAKEDGATATPTPIYTGISDSVKVNVVGTFTDGSSSVLYTGTINFP